MLAVGKREIRLRRVKFVLRTSEIRLRRVKERNPDGFLIDSISKGLFMNLLTSAIRTDPEYGQLLANLRRNFKDKPY